MILDTTFMSWIDHLPEVGDPIRNARSKLLEMADEAAELERHALALRGRLRAGQVELLATIMGTWSAAEVERAAHCAGGLNAKAGLLDNAEPTLRENLRGLDGTHLAAETVLAFRDGAVIPDPTMLSTATDDECRQALRRVQTWWDVGGAPIYERLRTPIPRRRQFGCDPRGERRS